MTIDFTNFGRKWDAVNHIGNGGEATYKGVLTLGKEAIDYKNTMLSFKGTMDGAKFVHGEMTSNGLVGGTKSIFSQSSANIAKELGSGNVAYHAHLFWGVSDKYVPGFVRALDKSVLETGAGQNILSKFGGAVVKNEAGTITSVTGGGAARFAGKTMSRIPVLGLLISTAFEVPDIIDGFKNGDGMAQIGRSAVNVACTTVCATALGALLAPIPGGAIVGAFVGGWIGNKLGKFMGNAIFGKSIKDKMKDGDMARETLKKWQSLSYPAMTGTASNNYKVQMNYGYADQPNYKIEMNYNYGSQANAQVDLQKGMDFLNNMNANLEHIISM